MPSTGGVPADELHCRLEDWAAAFLVRHGAGGPAGGEVLLGRLACGHGAFMPEVAGRTIPLPSSKHHV